MVDYPIEMAAAKAIKTKLLLPEEATAEKDILLT